MKKILLILSVVLAVFSLFVSCDNNPDVVRYHVTVRNGGEVYKEKEVADGDVYVLPAKPRNDSRPFKGWLVGKEILQPGEEVKITADTVITAVWTETCTVSFDLGDETLEKIESLTVEKGGTVKKPAAPSRMGYTFSGWKLNGNDFSFDTPITESITLVAEWSINTYTVTFDLCDSSLDKIADEPVDYGAHATEPLSSSIPDRTGYAFAGWYLNEEKYDFGNAVVTEDITLKAHWTANYCTVDFDTAGGSAVPSLKIKTGERINFVNEPESTREGYIFSGWKTQSGEDFDLSSPIESSMVLTAQWTPDGDTATVTLVDKSGNVIRKDDVKIGAVYTIPELGYEIKSCTTDDNKIINNIVTIEKKSTVLKIEKGTYKDYEIGSIGPGGGYIVFDADYSGSNEMYTHYFEGYSSDTLGWRYLEAATSDLDVSYIFGYYRGTGANSVIVSENDGKEIGKGRSNTAALVEKMGKTSLSETNGGDKAEYAAYAAQSYDGGGFSDWFLPSSKELEMLGLLNRMSKGSVKTGSTNYYWSSTEYDGTNAENTSFVNGGGIAGGFGARSQKNYVRPFRCF